MKDISRNAAGTETVVKTVIPTNGAVPTTRKFSIAQTTDKMGITTGGAIVKGVWWGLVIGAGAMLALGMWKNKINISYTK